MGLSAVDDVEGLAQLGHAGEAGDGEVDGGGGEDADGEQGGLGQVHEPGESVNQCSCEQAQQQGGGEVAHLHEEAHVDEAACVVGVDGQANQGCADGTDADAGDAERHAHEDGDGGNHFLDDFQAQEQVAAAFHLQQVEVDGVDGIPHRREADDLQIGHAGLPLGGDQGDDERMGQRGDCDHDGKHDEGGEAQHAAVAVAQAVVIVLDAAQHREGDLLNHLGEAL